jgi:hypothetical protein
MKASDISEDTVRAAMTVAIMAILARLALFAVAEPWTDEYLNNFLHLDTLG